MLKKCINLQVFATAGDSEFHHSGDFFTEPYASGAVNAPRHFCLNQRSNIVVRNHSLFLDEPGGMTAVAYRLVLQGTFATLVANWTIQRMVDQQKLQGVFLRRNRIRRAGTNFHSLGNRRCTGRHWFRCPLHFDQTHSAVCRDCQFLVIAKAGNVDARFVSNFYDIRTGLCLKLLSIDFDVDHGHGYC